MLFRGGEQGAFERFNINLPGSSIVKATETIERKEIFSRLLFEAICERTKNVDTSLKKRREAISATEYGLKSKREQGRTLMKLFMFFKEGSFEVPFLRAFVETLTTSMTKFIPAFDQEKESFEFDLSEWEDLSLDDDEKEEEEEEDRKGQEEEDDEDRVILERVKFSGPWVQSDVILTHAFGSGCYQPVTTDTGDVKQVSGKTLFSSNVLVPRPKYLSDSPFRTEERFLFFDSLKQGWVIATNLSFPVNDKDVLIYSKNEDVVSPSLVKEWFVGEYGSRLSANWYVSPTSSGWGCTKSDTVLLNDARTKTSIESLPPLFSPHNEPLVSEGTPIEEMDVTHTARIVLPTLLEEEQLTAMMNLLTEISSATLFLLIKEDLPLPS
jgi:hypothetical protein